MIQNTLFVTQTYALLGEHDPASVQEGRTSSEMQSPASYCTLVREYVLTDMVGMVGRIGKAWYD